MYIVHAWLVAAIPTFHFALPSSLGRQPRLSVFTRGNVNVRRGEEGEEGGEREGGKTDHGRRVLLSVGCEIEQVCVFENVLVILKSDCACHFGSGVRICGADTL